jgi:predicted transcriptional regulator
MRVDSFAVLLRLYDKIVPCHTATMSMSRSRASRVFTISFPEDLARQVEKLAQQESRNISELFREAFRSYQLARMQRNLDPVRGKMTKSQRSSAAAPASRN